MIYPKGAILKIPKITFPDGTTKSKYCVLLKNHLACFTTSRINKRLYVWQIIVNPSRKILGENQNKPTMIDCLNRLYLTESQIAKCRYVGKLQEDLMVQLENAIFYSDIMIKRLGKNPGHYLF